MFAREAIAVTTRPRATRRGDFVLFDETHPGAGIFHGHVTSFGDLPTSGAEVLRRGGMVTSWGKIR